MEEIVEAARALEREPGFPHAYVDRVRSAMRRSSATEWGRLSPREAALLVVRQAVLDMDAPTASSRPGVALAKRVVKRLTAWQFRYLEEQLNAFGQAVAGLGEALAGGIERLEVQLSEATQKLQELESRIDRLESALQGTGEES